MYGKDNHFLRGGVFASQYYLKGQHNRDVTGVNGDWYYVMDNQNRVGVFGQYSDFRFATAMSAENFRQTLLGGSWSHQIVPGSSLSVALYGGRESAVCCRTTRILTGEFNSVLPGLKKSNAEHNFQGDLHEN